MALLAPRTSLYTPSLARSSLVQPWRTGGSCRPISVTPRTYTGPQSWTWGGIGIVEGSIANLMQWFHTEESRGPRQGQGTSSRGRMGGLYLLTCIGRIKVTFRDSQGNDLKTVEANEGDDILSIAHEYDIDLEGACEGSIACSTCHVILEEDVFYQLEEPCDDENDMLDLAFGLTETSRLGCQVHVTRDLDGMTVQLPAATRNMYVDGAKGGH